ncbi:neutral zinc metallopeptidase [Ferrimonas lipolytica]|uniref:Zinc metallopeptidase n=1 Tax=Ferrimonas lipolytica TaxID=2724191 RepID=A0A6H1UBQ7_9GAMM|nr:neutral zinc metallopeptidase [Ferrimonas lipolytica]QIZ75803.1 zinc metallopeptidase [Ferrimonas lipolytica]
MRWRNLRRSSNIDDRRGRSSAAAGLPIAAIMRFLPLLMRTKLGKVALVIGALYLGYQQFSGQGLGLQQATESSSQTGAAVEDDNSAFVAAILATTESMWSQLMPGYKEPTLVLYSDVTNTGCGVGQAQSGPFYCPADQQIYIDLSFMDELKNLGAPGDFAFAYVVAHEVAHHVQNLEGSSTKVHQLQQQVSKIEANKLSVALELQADCYSGVWGHHVSEQLGILDDGDIEEGLQAASAIGDDRLQKMSGRAVQPEAFTHGSSAQRVKWFKQGFNSGNPNSCNTFEKR